MHHKHLISRTTRLHVHYKHLIGKRTRLHVHYKYLIYKTTGLHVHHKRLRVDGQKRKFSNTMMSYIIYYRITFPLFNVFYEWAKTIRIRYVWTRIFLKTEQKDLRFQKYPDTCGRGLYCGTSTLICFKLTFQIYCNKRIGRFTVVCSVPWPLNRSKAGGDLVLLQTFLFFICKWSCSRAC